VREMNIPINENESFLALIINANGKEIEQNKKIMEIIDKIKYNNTHVFISKTSSDLVDDAIGYLKKINITLDQAILVFNSENGNGIPRFDKNLFYRIEIVNGQKELIERLEGINFEILFDGRTC
jgi:uncharacterized HAD superfamily protein